MPKKRVSSSRFARENHEAVSAFQLELAVRRVGDLGWGDPDELLEVLLGPGKTKPSELAKAWDHVRESRLIRMLRQTANDEHSEPFKRLLHVLLRHLDIDPPAGTIGRLSEEPGAPVTKENRALRARWEEEGRPRITSKLCLTYAESLYPSEYKKAKLGSKAGKNLIAKIRTPLLKYSKGQLDTKSPAGNS